MVPGSNAALQGQAGLRLSRPHLIIPARAAHSGVQDIIGACREGDAVDCIIAVVAWQNAGGVGVGNIGWQVCCWRSAHISWIGHPQAAQC